jgi:hypothetical protein
VFTCVNYRPTASSSCPQSRAAAGRNLWLTLADSAVGRFAKRARPQRHSGRAASRWREWAGAALLSSAFGGCFLGSLTHTLLPWSFGKVFFEGLKMLKRRQSLGLRQTTPTTRHRLSGWPEKISCHPPPRTVAPAGKREHKHTSEGQSKRVS